MVQLTLPPTTLWMLSDIFIAGPESVSQATTTAASYVPVWTQTAMIWRGIIVHANMLATPRCSLQDPDESVGNPTSPINRTCEGVGLYMISRFGRKEYWGVFFEKPSNITSMANNAHRMRIKYLLHHIPGMIFAWRFATRESTFRCVGSLYRLCLFSGQ